MVTVLLNVRGRDVGSFVDDARQLIADRVSLPPGSYLEWSGQYENEVRARQRLQIVVPIVLVVIYVLLYLTYRSFLDAAQVLLALPFALAGGSPAHARGYNFSVAVCRVHRPLRHRRADRGRDGDLPGGGGGPQA